MEKCYLCPRNCGTDRAAGELGFCREGDSIRIARYSLHMWEEPLISGKRGSGTIFFSGCNLKCEFCQNRVISHGSKGESISVERLCEIMLELQSMGAENINLVTPTHFADKIAEALREVKKDLSIPVVYNTSSYEKVDTLRMLDGLVDIYLPDYKYFSDELALKYSFAKDYRMIAEAAIAEMFRQTGSVLIENGIMKKGIIIRHLVLPSCRRDSIAVLERISELLPKDNILVSVMSQYTPEFAIKADTKHKELRRAITSFEYSSVSERAISLGLDGFFQEKSSATSEYTPDF
ncbi:MAG: radical SAM protein [Clostridia bacterium]|nr:radical SAM protein [Clostridia bacterium]